MKLLYTEKIKHFLNLNLHFVRNQAVFDHHLYFMNSRQKLEKTLKNTFHWIYDKRSFDNLVESSCLNRTRSVKAIKERKKYLVGKDFF